MTSARIQQFCGKCNTNKRCYDGFRVCPRNFAEKNLALYVHENHFCLIWKTQNLSFKKAIGDDLEPNFKVVDNVIFENMLKISLNMNTNLEKSPISFH